MSKKLNKVDLMLLSNCVVCGQKKSTFIKSQELHNLIIFEMVSLEWIKTLIKFYLLETDSCRIAFETATIYL